MVGCFQSLDISAFGLTNKTVFINRSPRDINWLGTVSNSYRNARKMIDCMNSV